MSFILIIFMRDSEVMLLGEIRCQSLLQSSPFQAVTGNIYCLKYLITI